MNKQEIKEFAQMLINFKPDQPDQSFADKFDSILNFIYTDEVNKLTLGVDNKLLKKTLDVTWAEGVITLSIPATLRQKQIVRIWDVSDDNETYTNGLLFEIANDKENGEVWFKDKETWQWGESGAPKDYTLRFEYVPVALPLTNASDIPELLPSQYHHILAWRVANVFKGLREGDWIFGLDIIEKMRNDMKCFYALTYHDRGKLFL